MPPRTGAHGKPNANKQQGGASKPDSTSATAPLETYRKKRDPDRTPEPFGAGQAPGAQGVPAARPSAVPGERFVVQQHWARNMHFDLRLELEGVLKSAPVTVLPCSDRWYSYWAS